MTCSHIDRQLTNRLRLASIYLCFGLYMLLCHLPLPYYGDDLQLLTFVETQGFTERFWALYTKNGKIFTDLLAFAFCHIPLRVWKIFNTAVYVLVAILLERLFTKGRPQDALISCALTAIFPLAYLGTAGYIATCTNYLYPLAGCLLLACHIRNIWDGKKAGMLCHLLFLPIMAYILNQDQAACILVGGLLLCLCGAVLLGKGKKVIRWLIVYFLVAAIGYGIMFMLPGHINRMSDPSEMYRFLPEYADWSFGKKLYHGYTSTVALVFFHHTTIGILFFFMLFLVCWEKASRFCKVLSALPLCGFLISAQLPQKKFVFFDSEMPDLRPLSTLGGLTGFLFATGCLLIMVYLICRCISPNNRWLLLGILTLGAGSRLMMGFSATIYASQHRTFTYLLFSLLAGCLILLREMKNTQHAGEAGILLAFLLK